MRWYHAGIIAAVLLGGCIMRSITVRELRASDPVFTRTATGDAEALARCIQEDLEDKHGGAYGAMAWVMYETSHDGALVRLLGRSSRRPSLTVFEAAISPASPGQVELQLRIAEGWGRRQRSAITDAVDACTLRGPEGK